MTLTDVANEPTANKEMAKIGASTFNGSLFRKEDIFFSSSLTVRDFLYDEAVFSAMKSQSPCTDCNQTESCAHRRGHLRRGRVAGSAYLHPSRAPVQGHPEAVSCKLLIYG